jgi:4-diphosphocytidyl-2-C-methyl-D-erythritol kinase
MNARAGTRAYAHAKINLVLRILARETGGYHAIETLFQVLELADIVDVQLADAERTLTCDGPAMPAAGLGATADNLATRAAVAYCNAVKWSTGWNITIEKNIPVGGGLGGGSADAAAVLRAMEFLSPQPMGARALAELAASLGADIPFLVGGTALAWGWGRGDRLLPLQSLPRMSVALITFDQGVDTGAAYSAFAARRELSGNHAAGAMVYPMDAFTSWWSIAGIAANDFEIVVPEMHAGVARWLPVVRHAAARFAAQGAPALGQLSGSGATCFIISPPGKIPDISDAAGMRVLHTHTLTNSSSL